MRTDLDQRASVNFAMTQAYEVWALQAESNEVRHLLTEYDVPAVCKLMALSIEHVTRLRDELGNRA